METIGGISILLLAWLAWFAVPYGFRRLVEQIREQWHSDPKGKSTIGLGTILWIAICGVIFQYIPSAWSAVLIILVTHIIFLVIYELLSQARDSARLNELNREQTRIRDAQLATGEGWGRIDVLRKFKTTLYFKQYGQVQTTQGWRCSACSRNLYKEKDAEVDHILPVSKYPNLRYTESNLQILCRSCNSTKHAYDGDDWKKIVHKRRRQRNKRNKEGGA